jgi:hypothetical protein
MGPLYLLPIFDKAQILIAKLVGSKELHQAEEVDATKACYLYTCPAPKKASIYFYYIEEL